MPVSQCIDQGNRPIAARNEVGKKACEVLEVGFLEDSEQFVIDVALDRCELFEGACRAKSDATNMSTVTRIIALND